MTREPALFTHALGTAISLEASYRFYNGRLSDANGKNAYTRKEWADMIWQRMARKMRVRPCSK